MTILRRLVLAALFALALSPAFAQAPPPVPALPDSARQTSYTIASTTCGVSCPVNFALYGNAGVGDYYDWVEVYLNGVRVNYNDATYGWTLTSPSGPLTSIAQPITDAYLTFTNAQTGAVVIVGAYRPARLSQFSENQGVSARNLNVTFTSIIASLRETWDKINDVTGRGLFFAPGNTTGLMPLPSACASAFLGFDSTGLNPLCRAGGPGSGNVVGPSVSTINHLAAFGNVTGSALLDIALGTHLSIGSSTLSTDATGTGILATKGDIGVALPNLTTSQIYGGTGGAGVAQAFPLGTNVSSALQQTLNATGGLVGFSGALGTPSSGVGTNITGVNAAQLNGATFAAPGAIGGTTPAAIASTTLNPQGTITIKVRSTASSPVTVSATTDYLLCLDPTSNAITVNLPASPATGLTFLVKDCTGQATTHNITVTPSSGNVDGASTYVMATAYQSVAVTYTGSQWSIN